MGEHVVGAVDDIPNRKGIVVELEGRSIGVFNVDGTFYALLNRCLHQGGPLGCGVVFPFVDAEVRADGHMREYHADGKFVVACPWHGWEYDIETGECAADRTRRVRTFPVEVRDGEVVVLIEPPGGANGRARLREGAVRTGGDRG